MRSLRRAAPFIVFAVLHPAWGEPFDPWTQAARYRLEYRVDLGSIGADPRAAVEVWLPIPAAGPAQEVAGVEIESAWTHREAGDGLGNRFVHCRRDPGQPEGGDLVLRCVVRRLPYGGVKPSDAEAGGVPGGERFLAPNRRVPTGGRIREIATELCHEVDTPMQQLRALYDYVLRTMRYSKQGRGWGRGDAAWACETRYGNCTDFHSVLIAMARSQRIAARFIIGFALPSDRSEGDINGYHCWAELYDAGRGWIPIDASEAWKSKRHERYFGKLPADRVAFTTGRDLVLEPPQRGEPLNFFVYPYAEVDGRPVATPSWRLRFHRIADGASIR